MKNPLLCRSAWPESSRDVRKRCLTARCFVAMFVLGFEAKKRSGLSLLDYIVTRNHVHLLIRDTGPKVIDHSIQLMAGRSGQEYHYAKDASAHSG